MTRRLLPALLVALLLLAGIVVLPTLILRLEGPRHQPGSTQRDDPGGLSALYAVLASQPGISVSRHAGSGLPGGLRAEPRTLVLAAPPQGFFSPNPRRQDRERDLLVALLDAEVRRGSRLIVLGSQAFRWIGPPAEGAPPEEATEPLPGLIRPEPDASSPAVAFGIGIDRVAVPQDLPTRTWQAPLRMPDTLSHPGVGRGWGKFDSLRPESGKVWYRAERAAVVVQVPWGAGEVIAIDAHEILANLLLRDAADNREFARWLFAAHPEIIFLEQHLDPRRQRGLVALARGYGLTGAYALLVGLGLLVAWYRSVPLVPPAPAPEVNVLPYQPTAGLEALLRRAISPAGLAAACREQAAAGARPGEAARIAALPPPLADPVADHRRAVEALRPSASRRSTPD